MKTIMLPGRWQAPGGPHEGHRYLVDLALSQGHLPLVGIRQTKHDADNPYTLNERHVYWRQLYGDDIQIFHIPELGGGLEIWHGRNVGWTVKEIVVPDDIAKISGTKLRRQAKDGGV